MKVKIQKWGNSLALRIPKALAVDTDMDEGTTVELTRGKNGILVKPAVEEVTLESLLDRVTPDNLHGETDFGGPVGKEAWRKLTFLNAETPYGWISIHKAVTNKPVAGLPLSSHPAHTTKRLGRPILPDHITNQELLV